MIGDCRPNLLWTSGRQIAGIVPLHECILDNIGFILLMYEESACYQRYYWVCNLIIFLWKVEILIYFVFSKLLQTKQTEDRYSILYPHNSCRLCLFKAKRAYNADL